MTGQACPILVSHTRLSHLSVPYACLLCVSQFVKSNGIGIAGLRDSGYMDCFVSPTVRQQAR